ATGAIIVTYRIQSPCGAGFTFIAGGYCREFITSTTTSSFTVPKNWNSSNNTVDVIGAGGGGGFDSINGLQIGGGGGAWSRKKNVSLTAGNSVSYSVGVGGTSLGPDGGDTYFCNLLSSCGSISGGAVVAGAKGGQSPQNGTLNGGAGGDKSLGVGDS